MQLVQIRSTQEKPVTIREMFERMAQQEAEMVRAARAAAGAGIPSYNSDVQ